MDGWEMRRLCVGFDEMPLAVPRPPLLGSALPCTPECPARSNQFSVFWEAASLRSGWLPGVPTTISIIKQKRVNFKKSIPQRQLVWGEKLCFLWIRRHVFDLPFCLFLIPRTVVGACFCSGRRFFDLPPPSPWARPTPRQWQRQRQRQRQSSGASSRNRFVAQLSQPSTRRLRIAYRT